MFMLQYLEDSPELDRLDLQAVLEKLRRALDCLPLRSVLIGWRLPPGWLEACRQVCQQAGVRLLRWHPLLTGDGVFMPRPQWQTLGLDGAPIAGFGGMAEFTFVCPNHPEAAQASLRHVEEICAAGVYDGLFLDRIRFPSPAADPLRHLGCFCPHCVRRAAQEGLDLQEVQQHLRRMTETPQGRVELVGGLLAPAVSNSPQTQALEALIAFRQRSVADFVARAARLAKDSAMEVGLDCFSPALTRMVGQDLTALGGCADWIKIMSYAHTLGPAGLPFELLGLLDALTGGADLPQTDALQLLARALGFALPPDRRTLQNAGLAPQALAEEVRRGVRAAAVPVLAGIELVEIAAVAHLDETGIAADVRAVRQAGAAGVVISWDLLHIPLRRLEILRRVWLEDSSAEREL
ncbi:MAG: hypothetical protein HPY45_15660 [Anaerolineae bacterium]|nr:hypothetical protein [Anaerolineae bacterium]